MPATTSVSELRVMGRRDVAPGTCGNVDRAARRPWTTSWGRRIGRPENPQWTRIDFGAQVDVCRITLIWGTAAPGDYRLELSADGRSWIPAAEGRFAGPMGAAVLVIDGAGRYARISTAGTSTSLLKALTKVTVNVTRP